MIKFRAERNWITLVGRWMLPGRKRTEYYWSPRPMAARFIGHQAGLANACAPYFPFADFSSPVLRIGADTLIPDKLMTMSGVRYFVEYDNHGQETQKVLGKKLALYRAHFLSLSDEELKQTAMLFITSCGDRRVNNLLQLAGEMKLPNVCATTLSAVRTDRWGEVWSVPESEGKLALCEPALRSQSDESRAEMDVSAELASLSCEAPAAR